MESAKRARVGERLDRQYWCAREKRRDFLKELYPHERDAHCHMDELTHTYFVLGGRYEYSVSAVWKVFFTDFDASAKAAEMISRAKTEKLRCLTASVYNLHAYLVFGKDLLPDSEAFWAEVARAAREGRELYEAEAPFGLPEVEAEMRSLLATKGSQRGRRSCYFLAACGANSPGSPPSPPCPAAQTARRRSGARCAKTKQAARGSGW